MQCSNCLTLTARFTLWFTKSWKSSSLSVQKGALENRPECKQAWREWERGTVETPEEYIYIWTRMHQHHVGHIMGIYTAVYTLLLIVIILQDASLNMMIFIFLVITRWVWSSDTKQASLLGGSHLPSHTHRHTHLNHSMWKVESDCSSHDPRNDLSMTVVWRIGIGQSGRSLETTAEV